MLNAMSETGMELRNLLSDRRFSAELGSFEHDL
jgi:hypothetical protein